MQACAEERGGTMAAIIGLDDEAVEEICASLDDVWLANYNSPGQVVISGSVEARAGGRRRCAAAGAQSGCCRCPSPGFHTPFMAGAAEALSEALCRGDVRCAGTRARFFSTTEVRYPEPDELAEVLARQLMSPVRFRQSMEAAAGGRRRSDQALEVGPGNVLSGLDQADRPRLAGGLHR